MTDKKLLELAAKAAGITWIRDYKDGPMKVMMPFTREWNPLTDDGDALRLAVKLHLFDSGSFMSMRLEKTRKDPSKSDGEIARRAIVRAAAEIGKTL